MPRHYGSAHKLAATWIPTKDFELLQQLAKTNKVRLSAYIRAIIVDALNEETFTNTIQNTNHEVV